MRKGFRTLDKGTTGRSEVMRYILRFMDYKNGYQTLKRDVRVIAKSEDTAIKKALAYVERTDARKEKIEVTVFEAYTWTEAERIPASVKLKQIVANGESYLCKRIGFAYKEKGKAYWKR